MNKLQLDRNEQIGVLLCGLALVALILLSMYVYSGPRRKYISSRANVTGLVDQLATMQNLRQGELTRIEHQRKLVDLLQNRPADFSLFGFFDSKIKEMNLIAHANASTATRGRDTKDSKMEMISLSLNNLGLTQIIDMLHALYSSNNLIVVQRIDRLGPAPTGGGLSCELVLATLKK